MQALERVAPKRFRETVLPAACKIQLDGRVPRPPQWPLFNSPNRTQVAQVECLPEEAEGKGLAVTCELGDSKQATTTRPSADPTWNEFVQFLDISPDDTLAVTLNADGELLGEGFVPVATLEEAAAGGAGRYLEVSLTRGAEALSGVWRGLSGAALPARWSGWVCGCRTWPTMFLFFR